MIHLQKFSTLIELLKYFSSEKNCIEYLELLRWPNGMTCAYKDCAHDKVSKYSNGKVYKCAKCRKQFSIKVGTIFEDSKIPLQKWYAAIYLITSHKKGISSIQLGKDIGVTQKTAWYMNHRVRHSLGWDVEDKLSGIVEADETFIGGKEGNKHKSKRTEGQQGRSVSVINHNAKEYVNGNTHTNTMEGFWSLLKRGIVGIYHSMSNKHLQKYLDEFVFRYNTRQLTEADRFNLMLSGLATHLPYKNLIQNEQQQPSWATDFKPIDREARYQQGSFGF